MMIALAIGIATSAQAQDLNEIVGMIATEMNKAFAADSNSLFSSCKQDSGNLVFTVNPSSPDAPEFLNATPEERTAGFTELFQQLKAGLPDEVSMIFVLTNTNFKVDIPATEASEAWTCTISPLDIFQ